MKIVAIVLNHEIPLVVVDENAISLQPTKAIRLGIALVVVDENAISFQPTKALRLGLPLPLVYRENFVANEPASPDLRHEHTEKKTPAIRARFICPPLKAEVSFCSPYRIAKAMEFARPGPRVRDSARNARPWVFRRQTCIKELFLNIASSKILDLASFCDFWHQHTEQCFSNTPKIRRETPDTHPEKQRGVPRCNTNRRIPDRWACLALA